MENKDKCSKECSCHIHPSIYHGFGLPVYIDNTPIPPADTVHYLGLYRSYRKTAHLHLYVPNIVIAETLQLLFVRELAIGRYKHFHSEPTEQSNSLAQSLLTPTVPTDPSRRLERE